MKLSKSSINTALCEIASFFRKNGITSIDQALNSGVAVDCSRILGSNDNFIVTVEMSSNKIEDKELINDLNRLTRTEMKWHSNENEKIFVGFIDDPQFNGNKCSFFIIEKFLNEIIKIAS